MSRYLIFVWTIGILLGAVERFTRTMWLGLIAVACLPPLFLSKAGASPRTQLLVFAIGLVVTLGSRAVLLRRYQRAVIRTTVSRGVVVDQVDAHAGIVRFGGRDWSARTFGPPISPGQTVVILSSAQGQDDVIEVAPADD